jgi:hypothetical protein
MRITYPVIILLALLPAQIIQSAEPAIPKQLEENGKLANQALRACRDYVRGWLDNADPKTGLIRERLTSVTHGWDIWNGRNNAADHYPFMVLTCYLADNEHMPRMKQMLETEQKLTNRVGVLGDWYSFSKQGFEYPDIDMERITFDNAEYVKDGLLCLTEYMGPSPWCDRMLGIVDELWKRADVDSPYGKLPSKIDEVNGDMMQASARLYWMTGNEKLLDEGLRISDEYLLGSHNLIHGMPELRLRDHGCEVISGATELYLAAHYKRPEKAAQYKKPLHEAFDRILEVARNEHGMFYDVVDPKDGKIIDKELVDCWGYDYNAFYTVYLLDGDTKYRDAVRKAMSNLYDHYRNYAWEGTSADGYADSIESAINLYNREPIESTAKWIDSEMQVMMAMQKPDGTINGVYPDGNFARTSIMYALMKQQGVTVDQWRADLILGAERKDKGVEVLVQTKWPWSGKVKFDKQRHKENLKLPIDYPRINQFSEWFTAEPGKKYHVTINGGDAKEMSGEDLIKGIDLSFANRRTAVIEVLPAD